MTIAVANELICLADLVHLIRAQTGMNVPYHRLQRLALDGEFEVRRVGGRTLVQRGVASAIAETYKRVYRKRIAK